MTPVALKGRDATLAIDKGTQTININSNAQIYINHIDLNDEPHTWRRVEIRNSALVKRYISFHIRLYGYPRANFSADPPRLRIPAYPLRHVIDFAIFGANGPQGFVPSAASSGGGSGATPEAYTSTNAAVPQGLASLFNIYIGAPGIVGPGLSASGQGSNLFRGWQINENNMWAEGWWNHSYLPFPSGQNNYLPEAEVYTRPSNLIGALTRLRDGNTAWPRFSPRAFEIARALSLFWSPSNVVTIRMTLEMLTETQRFLTFQKFWGGYTYS